MAKWNSQKDCESLLSSCTLQLTVWLKLHAGSYMDFLDCCWNLAIKVCAAPGLGVGFANASSALILPYRGLCNHRAFLYLTPQRPSRSLLPHWTFQSWFKSHQGPQITILQGHQSCCPLTYWWPVSWRSNCICGFFPLPRFSVQCQGNPVACSEEPNLC